MDSSPPASHLSPLPRTISAIATWVYHRMSSGPVLLDWNVIQPCCQPTARSLVGIVGNHQTDRRSAWHSVTLLHPLHQLPAIVRGLIWFNPQRGVMWFDDNFQTPAAAGVDVLVDTALPEHAVAHASPLLQTAFDDRWVVLVFSSKP